MTRFSPFLQAAILALTAYFLFSVADISAKVLTSTYPVSLCSFIPALIATLGLGFRILHQKGWNGFKTKKWKLHAARSVLMAAMVLLCVTALKTVPIADFYCIIFLSPFLILCISRFICHEHVPLYRTLVISMAFVGVIIAIGPRFSDLTIGYLLVAISTVFGSSNVFLVRKMGREEYAPLYGFYPLLTICLVNLPFVIQHIPTTIQPVDGVIFLGYGLALIGAHTLLPMAFSMAPSTSTVAPFHYSQMLWGILSGIFLFENPPQTSTFIGGGIIMGAGALLLWKERLNLRKNAEPPSV